MMTVEQRRENNRNRMQKRYNEMKKTKYDLNVIQKAIEEADSAQGWPEFGLFKSCFIGMTEEQKEHMCMLISAACIKCNGMGPLSAAELIWAAAAHTRRINKVMVFEGGRR